MPVYDYQCKKCKHVFEKFSTIADREIPLSEPCPECKEENSVERYITEVGLAYGFRGSTIQSHAPEGFKDILRNMKHKIGRPATGIEL